ncbi:3'-kinase [Pseudomonas sp. JQ170]|uniref:aminoglycoside phosphotransferase family protein n=1 Tax=unclassified Pseudomonas TaxID=196821 RepID=UPI00264E241A|nr:MULTISPECIES: aminoglycoside phosphotransferase family protein [unclassified Pseudomonas]MDN7142642.1 3'-kinase [Pseudomonas sp. JQ170]WRO75016.1 aminoglycoside phosphotransferase family protein [Pseudomonas sp. 170C]
MFEPYLQCWQLIPDGAPIITASSHLLAVMYQGQPAMLKVAHTREEQHGAEVMKWWNGEGAAQVLALADNGLLMERALGPDSLTTYAEQGRDEHATRILCQTVALLHAPRNRPALPLITLRSWFSSLWPAADAYGGIYKDSAEIARHLLATPQEECVLHGDIHHGNVLDFGPRGWRAIDPKCLYGERTFDYANLFCNPSPCIATDAQHFTQRLALVCEIAALPRERLLQWIVAWCGLSAAWFREDDLHEHAAPRLSVAQLALNALETGN